MRGRVWLWGALVLTGVNCVAILDGEHPYQQGDTSVTGKSCKVESDCDDKNPCTIDTCDVDTYVCDNIAQADGLAPDSAQTPANCKQLQCESGQSMDMDDPADVLDDNNSCTADTCNGGAPMNEVLPDNTPCTQGTVTGTCSSGTCKVSCTKNSECDDSNPCTEDLCNTADSTCVYTQLDGVPTPGVTPIAGDCKLHICAGGIDTEINDDADVKDDSNPCTNDTCNNGAPINTNVDPGLACTPGDARVCDGNGACVDCTVAAHCVGITETECEKRSCVNNTCQIAYQGTNTPASPVLQTSGDCRKVVCNGSMGTTSVADNTDVPVDGNLCTKDVCTNGVPSNPPEAQNLSCGGMQVCDGMGKCVGCTAASQCPGVDDFCKTRTCNANVCGFSYTANGTALPAGQTTGDCKSIVCDGMGNMKSIVSTTDIPVDNNQCTSDVCSASGNPSNPPTTVNSPCSQNGGDACDGSGNCKKSLGRACAGSAECVSAKCVDGVCCNSSCSITCQACNVPGNLGVCTDVPKGQDDGTCSGATQSCNTNHVCGYENGQPCAGSSSCLSGFCADGYCCDSDCMGACKSCGQSGSIGTCSNLMVYVDDTNPAGACTGNNTCDGMGACKLKDFQSCTMNSECAGGSCGMNMCLP